jgi:peroxiredoxin Q/BCP
MSAVKVGDEIADFTLPDQHGVPRTLSELLKSGPVALFFYPAALSGGCTKEACRFRDLSADFAKVGAQPIGISVDPVATQLKFAEQNRLNYPLLADTEGEIARAFGVKRRFGPLPVKRATFVIGADRRLVAAVSSEFSMDVHADRALAALAPSK